MKKMNFKNLKIGTLLMLGFGTMFLFVVVLGTVAYRQSGQLHLQTEIIYNHPVKTRQTIGEITSKFLLTRINIRDFLLEENLEDRQKILDELIVNQSDVLIGIEKLRESYLGPREDPDALNREMIRWNSITQESIQMISSGKPEEARQLYIPDGTGPKQAIKVVAALQKISNFATNKASEILANSIVISHSLKLQLLLLVSLIVILSLVIYSILFRNISTPLKELTEATQRFKGGDRSSRSSYASPN